MNLKGKIVHLRAIEKEDLNFLRMMINDSEMEKLVVGWSFPISQLVQEKWFDSILNDKNNIRFIVEVENKSIGFASLTNIDWKNGKACNGIKLYSDSVRGKGYGTDIVETIMKYAFEELRLNKLYSTILEYNQASLKLYEKCGWKQEGILRKSVFKNGKYNDEIFIGVLKEEYNSEI